MIIGFVLLGLLVLVAGKSLSAQIHRTERQIMAKISTLNATLNTVVTTLTKVQAEIQALKDQLIDVDIPADAQATLDRLVALAGVLDDMNADVSPPPPPPTP